MFRQKVMILITKAGIQAEVCSGQKLVPASSHPAGLTAPSGLIGAHGYKVKTFFFFFVINDENIFIMSGEIMTPKFHYLII